jgi:hypothetical protein
MNIQVSLRAEFIHCLPNHGADNKNLLIRSDTESGRVVEEASPQALDVREDIDPVR